MNKIIKIILISMPMTVCASEYVSIISNTNSLYTSGLPNNPSEDFNYSIQTWKDVSDQNISDFMPMAMDGSSHNQAYYKINVGQEPFKGETGGFKAYDENYNVNKLNNCNSGSNGFCSSGNLQQVNYNHKNTSGKYYFEIEVSGQAHTDCIGMGKTTSSSIARSDRIGACYIGNQRGGYEWDQNSTYTKYKTGGTQGSGTIYQIWIDYDTEIMSIMEYNSTKDDYTNFDVISKDAMFMNKIPWTHIGKSINKSEIYPTISDGSSDGNAKFSFNFGQRPFLGNSEGFLPYNKDYNPTNDKSDWIGVANYYDDDEYIQPYNTNKAYYKKSYSSGQYYFEVTSQTLTTAPYYEGIGFSKINSAYVNTIGAIRTGRSANGYYIGNGLGSYPKFKKSGNQPSGTTFQVFIDYDKGLVSVMTLNSTKSDYINYYNVIEAK